MNETKRVVCAESFCEYDAAMDDLLGGHTPIYWFERPDALVIRARRPLCHGHRLVESIGLSISSVALTNGQHARARTMGQYVAARRWFENENARRYERQRAVRDPEIELGDNGEVLKLGLNHCHGNARASENAKNTEVVHG